MTKKQHKVMVKNYDPWGNELWVDSKLEKLIWQATHLPQGDHRFKLTAYVVSTPIPPWIANQQENYGMVTTVTRHRFSKEIAEELLATHGDFAYLKVLEELESGQSQLNTASLWRDVLLWLEEMKGDT